MPVYEYRCSSCEEGFEIEQKMGSAKKKKCPSCKKHKLERLINLYNRAEKPEVDEPITETWQDLSVYGAIARVCTDGEWLS